MSHLQIKSISLSSFKEALSRYPATAPDKLKGLDALRYDTIPSDVAAKDVPHLTKDEVETLVEWKLKHGTYRPNLLALVQSNSADSIVEATTTAFKKLQSLAKDGKPLDPVQASSLPTLTKLKGIGPATASLLLSAFSPDEIPFFSDELFRWCCWDADAGKGGKGGGWKRQIKYQPKEYAEIVSVVRSLRLRLGTDLRAVDAEKVAYVLGKEGVGLDADGDEESKEKGDDADATVEEKALDLEAEVTDKIQAKKSKATTKKAIVSDTKQPQKKGSKRKVADTKPPVEGTRKSARTRK